ncbi:hypothetical protein PR202_gb18669 [Eleusine coracana subsp. coracana]|uniref:Carbohydrate kinase PfkB domain-containing protein n=1 Tax=Eleusine coracana subsp. coracana TaxID=191504 RepID=A0AAV5F676_ELECO|nr:hypothetical protein PR202_gb18669 [Eleusine coracana subsp. coracana]
MALQTLNPLRHPAPVSTSPASLTRQPLLHLPPRRRLASGAARPRAVAVAVSGAVNESRRRGPPREGGHEGKETDLATLGNLCVDVVLSVPQLPPAQHDERKAYMERLAASPPDQCCFLCNVSRADFSEEPAFSWIRKLPVDIRTAIHHSKILFCNGYAFDEFLPDVIASSIDCGIDAGTAVFFDPGPRGRSLLHGTLDEQRALKHALKLSDVLLLTSDEAESLTNIKHPIQAGQELLKKGIRTKQVVIKMGSKGSIMITENAVSCAPSFKINVVDTVGCGDSFTAAIAFGFLHDLPAVSTLTLANAVGAATATGYGAGRNVAHLDKVLHLLREANLNEEGTAWSELIEGSSLCSGVSVLSRTAINGFSDSIVHIPIGNVVSELLPMFEAVSERSTVQA